MKHSVWYNSSKVFHLLENCFKIDVFQFEIVCSMCLPMEQIEQHFLICCAVVETITPSMCVPATCTIRSTWHNVKTEKSVVHDCVVLHSKHLRN